MPDDKMLPPRADVPAAEPPTFTAPVGARRPLRPLWIVLLCIVAALALLAILWDWNWFKGPLERRISERTGRSFVIGGDLDVDLGLPLRVRMHDVTFANPPWAKQPQMLTLESADFSIELLRLLHGQVVVPDVILTRPQIDLEKGADGQSNNWSFGDAASPRPGVDPGNVPVIGRVAIDHGVLHFDDPRARTQLDASLDTITDAAGNPGIKVEAKGQYQGQKLETLGTGGAVLSLADANLPYPLDAKFRIGATRGTLAGQVTGLLALQAADLQLDVHGESLAELFPLIHVALPPTPPYHVKGRVVRDGATWRMDGFTGRVGDSDLSGSAAITLGGARPRVEAKLVSKLLDLDDLGGVIGAPPQTGPGETASPKQRAEAAQQKAMPTMLPDKPFNLARLRAMDADIIFEGKSIRGRTPVDDLNLHLKMDDGMLHADPLSFGVAGGNVVSTIDVDARGERLDATAAVEVRRVDLHKLFPANAMLQRSVGLVGGRAKLRGKGNSFADLVGHADGTLGLASSGGQVSNLLLELLGLDAAETLRRLFRGDKQVTMRCAVADFDVADGVMKTRSMLVDTTDTSINIDGTINLRDEALDLTLHPLPKDYSPLALRSPLHLRGTFKNPKVRPDAKLLVRGGIAVVLGALIGPVAALIPLIETGPGDDVDCERLIQAVQKHAASGRPAP